jgi:hypothetical protein
VAQSGEERWVIEELASVDIEFLEANEAKLPSCQGSEEAGMGGPEGPEDDE